MPLNSKSSKWLYIIIVLILCGAAIGMWYFKQGKKPALASFREAQVNYTAHEGIMGTRTTLTLPDSTEILLNGNSTLLVPDNYAQTHVLLLDGEAWISTKHAIKLVTNILTITNTAPVSFRIRCFEAQQGATAYLGSGTIQVAKSYHSTTDNQAETLGIGNMVLANKEIDLMEKETYQPAELDHWLKGELAFSKVPFMNAMHTLEEWYGTEIYVDGDVSGLPVVDGSFPNQSLEKVLQSMQKSMSFSYHFKGDRVKLKVK
ncbi:FecR family protein [[Flexibacter] sp. ATCC 35208]|uniref:FecR family protein n=1 Tax=[Flexibacter] sp. ATCC 35208 TaxID=1936242 RepID=UPI00117E8D6C|nr:FecR family protein [[Flexibacter] sp. ATCC 35208]